MDSKVNYALIGLLVIILSILLVAVILWLSVGTEQKVHDTYQAYIQESVSGLNRKAPVKYRGVEVGYVRDISLIPDRPSLAGRAGNARSRWSRCRRQATTPRPAMRRSRFRW